MKKSFKIIFFIFGILFALESFGAELPCSKADPAKDKQFADYCNNLSSCTSKFNPATNGSSLTKVKLIPFSPVKRTEEASSENDPINVYKEYLSNLGVSGADFGPGPLEQASFVYVETQNAVYNCAVMQAKIKVIEGILKYVKSSDSSNIKTKMESQMQSLKTEINKRECNDATASVNKSYKEILLRGITYNYCNYRFYLNYLSIFPQYNVNAPPISGNIITPGQERKNLGQMASNIFKQSDAVAKEMRHSKQVYNQSFSSFSEFENTYGLHIMLMFIHDDYILLRKNLSDLLSPISQLAYKIPQAQKK